MKLRNRIFYLFIAVMFTVTVGGFTGCNKVKRDALIVYPNWAEGIALTHLAKIALEEKGLNIEIKRLEPGPIYASLSRGDADFCLDAWLPYTHQKYWEQYGDKLDVAGAIFGNGTTGLVVPSYVDINSIEELNANKYKFQSKIFGIGTGAGIHANTEAAIQSYNLDFNQVSSSETSMITALKKATRNNEWIVITGWKPHFMWANFDLKTLEDPKNIYPTDEIRIVTRKGFAADQPIINSFLKDLKLTEDELYELMTLVDKDSKPEIGAKEFYLKYKDRF